MSLLREVRCNALVCKLFHCPARIVLQSCINDIKKCSTRHHSKVHLHDVLWIAEHVRPAPHSRNLLVKDAAGGAIWEQEAEGLQLLEAVDVGKVRIAGGVDL